MYVFSYGEKMKYLLLFFHLYKRPMLSMENHKVFPLASLELFILTKTLKVFFLRLRMLQQSYFLSKHEGAI